MRALVSLARATAVVEYGIRLTIGQKEVKDGKRDAA